jgi:protein NrfD
MKEELIISGRNLPLIDPHLEIWHWPIALYLFLGGLAAGILFFAAYYVIKGKEDQFPAAVKWAPIVVPIALVIGLLALVVDLKNPINAYRLYMTFKIASPMSWGAWTLLAVTPLSFIWVASFMKELVPGWDWKWSWLNAFERLVIQYRKVIAWVMIVLAVILGIYTGILLSAFNARPLWNTALLGPLFLVSGLSTGAATIMWLSRNHQEKMTFARIDLLLIVIELFFIVHLFMGFLAGPEVQLESASLFLGGQYTLLFWGGVVGFGLVFPALLEILELWGKKIPAIIPALLILIGGFLFRMIMVEAGELTRYLY